MSQLSPSTRTARRRRTVNEINMVPFIDVMLVLLVIFMVTAPMLTPAAIDVPSAGAAQRPSAQHIAHVLLDAQGLRLKTPNQPEQALSQPALAAAAAQWQSSQPPGVSAVLIQAERSLPYERVVELMSALQAAGVQRVALGVNSAH